MDLNDEEEQKHLKEQLFSTRIEFAVITATWWQGCMVVVAASAAAAAGVVISMMGIPMMSDNRHGNPKALKL